MKKLLMAAFSGFAFLMFVSAASAGPILQMRLVTETAAGDCDCDDMAIAQKNDDAGKKELLHVMHKVLIDQTDLESAEVITDNLGHPQITIRFNANGAKHFAEVTRININERLAIIVDGKLYSAPTIRSEISESAVITGSFSKEEAKDLAAKLNEAARKK